MSAAMSARIHLRIVCLLIRTRLRDVRRQDDNWMSQDEKREKQHRGSTGLGELGSVAVQPATDVWALSKRTMPSLNSTGYSLLRRALVGVQASDLRQHVARLLEVARDTESVSSPTGLLAFRVPSGSSAGVRSGGLELLSQPYEIGQPSP